MPSAHVARLALVAALLVGCGSGGAAGTGPRATADTCERWCALLASCILIDPNDRLDCEAECVAEPRVDGEAEALGQCVARATTCDHADECAGRVCYEDARYPDACQSAAERELLRASLEPEECAWLCCPEEVVVVCR